LAAFFEKDFEPLQDTTIVAKAKGSAMREKMGMGGVNDRPRRNLSVLG
jgi:hypothetical protein